MISSLLSFTPLTFLAQKLITLFLREKFKTFYSTSHIHRWHYNCWNNIKNIEVVKSSLDTTFKIKDLCHLKFFSGLVIARTRKEIHIIQSKYALKILVGTRILRAKPITTPMVKKYDKLFDQNTLLHDILIYRRTTGSLLYLVNTRLDINFSVQFLI